MPEDNILVGASPTRFINASAASAVRVTKGDGATVYYKSEANVTSVSNDGSLTTAGQSETFTAPTWFISTSAGSKLFTERIPDWNTDMATQAELDAKFNGDELKEASLPNTVDSGTGVYAIRSFNGSTDGTAINNALTALGGPGVVLLPRGTGVINTPVTLGTGQQIIGRGENATKLEVSSVNGINLVGTLGTVATLAKEVTAGAMTVEVTAGGGASFASDDGVLLNDGTKQELCEVASVAGDVLTLERPARFAYSAAGPTKSATVVKAPRDAGVSHLALIGKPVQAIKVEYAINPSIKAVRITGASANMIQWTRNSRGLIHDCSLGAGAECLVEAFQSGWFDFSHNNLGRSSWLGFGVATYCSEFVIGMNRIAAVKTYGIFLNNYCDSGTVAGNVIDGTIRIPEGGLDENAYGITLQSNVTGITVNGNLIRGGNTGIYLAMNASNNTIEGNIALNAVAGGTVRTGGIYLDTEADSNTIVGNYIANPQRSGILLQTSCEHNTIVGNRVTGWNGEAEQDGGIALIESGPVTGCPENIIGSNQLDGVSKTRDGVLLRDSSTNIITGNLVRKCGVPIREKGTTNGSRIDANQLVENASAPTIIGTTTLFDQAAWTELSLVNEWVNFEEGFSKLKCRRAAEGWVEVVGVIKSGKIAENTVITTLPEGFRPSSSHRFAIVSNGVFGDVWVESSGELHVGKTISATWAAIEIRFRTS